MLESVRLRCLIVDDNASFLHASRALLERQGINVVGVATTSREALQRAKELNPDLILVDVDLGADYGFELARELAVGCAACKVILISAHPEMDLEDLIAESSALGFVAKFDLSVGAIEEVLRRSGPAAGDRP
jgi:DNA-binding NarL/FixJ family response regulator